MQNYEVGITGAGSAPDNPKVKSQNVDKAKIEKAAVQDKLTKEVTGKANGAKENKADLLAEGINAGAIMGFEKTAKKQELDISEEDQKHFEEIEKELSAKKDSIEAEMQVQKAYDEKMEGLKKEKKAAQEKINEQIKNFAPNFVGSADVDADFEDVDPKYDLKDPEVYHDQFIEENGGEPLTRSQIKDKIKEIERELKSDSPMTNIEYDELQMKRNVLIDMLHE